MPSYCTVKFEDTGEVSVVPAVWLTGGITKCRWPLYKNPGKVAKAAVERETPANSWTTHVVTVFRIHESYEAARGDALQTEESLNKHINESSSGECWGVPKEEVGPDEEMAPKEEVGHDEEMVFLAPASRPPPPTDLDPSASVTQQQMKTEPGATAHDTELISDLVNATQSMVHGLARCESRLHEQAKVLDNLCGLVQGLQLHLVRAASPELDLSTLNDLLPIMTLQEFEHFEIRLSSDEDFRNTLRRRLVALGGHDVRSAVKSCLDTLLHNTLQIRFNWEGRVSWKTKTNEIKKPFKPTNSCRIMLEVLTSKGHLHTDERQVGRAIMVYLRNAPDRCGGRTRRSLLAGGPQQQPSM